MICRRKGTKCMQGRKVIGKSEFDGLKTFFDKKSYKEKSYLDLEYYSEKIKNSLTVGQKYDIFDRGLKKEFPKSKFLGFSGVGNNVMIFETKRKYKITFSLISYALNEVQFVESKVKK